MSIEQIKESYEKEPRTNELHKMRSDLIMFVNKMKSKGFLASVDYEEIPMVYESREVTW